MKPHTRQTLIGVLGMTLVMLVALREGINGRVSIAYFIGVVAQTTPCALENLPISIGGG